MSLTLKRQNFNTTPEQEAELTRLRELLDAPSVKDAILRAARVVALLAEETGNGGSLYIKGTDGTLTRLLIPELEPVPTGKWTYLVTRPHEWRRQLSVKGRKLLASTVWSDILANAMTVAEAADNWDLPPEAIDEIVRYSESHLTLLHMEAEEERRRLSPEKEPDREPVPAAR